MRKQRGRKHERKLRIKGKRTVGGNMREQEGRKVGRKREESRKGGWMKEKRGKS